MGKRIEVEPHLSLEELRSRYLGADRAIERTRWHALWLLAQGRTSEEVAEVTARRVPWVRRMVKRFNADADAGVSDRRQQAKGHPPLLSPSQRAELAAALEGPAPDGGLWSGPKVAQWMGERLARTIRPQRGWDALRRAGFTLQRPRPRHQQADAAAQAGFPGRASPDLCARSEAGAAG